MIRSNSLSHTADQVDNTAKPKKRRIRSTPRYFTEQEAELMFNAADKERDRLLLRLLWQSGGRTSEVCSIRVRDIQPDCVRLVNLKQGGYSEKVVGIGQQLYDDLMQYCSGNSFSLDDYIFPSRKSKGSCIGRKMVFRIVKGLSTKLNISKPHTNGASVPAWPHCFRHGCAVNLLRKTKDLSVVQGQLGHTRIESTGIYLQLMPEDRLNRLKGVFNE